MDLSSAKQSHTTDDFTSGYPRLGSSTTSIRGSVVITSTPALNGFLQRGWRFFVVFWLHPGTAFELDKAAKRKIVPRQARQRHRPAGQAPSSSQEPPDFPPTPLNTGAASPPSGVEPRSNCSRYSFSARSAAKSSSWELDCFDASSLLPLLLIGIASLRLPLLRVLGLLLRLLLRCASGCGCAGCL